MIRVHRALVAFIALGLFLPTAWLAGAETPKSPLDGQVFTVEIVSSDGDKTTDEVRFQSGGFLFSRTYFEMKFSAGQARISGAADKYSFTAVMNSSLRADALAKWEGTVTGDSIQGTVTVSMRGLEKMTFTGRRGELPPAAPVKPPGQ